MTEQNTNPLGKRILQIEQAEMEASDIARVVAAYYSALKAEGISEAIAAQLTGIFSQLYWANVFNKGVGKK